MTIIAQELMLFGGLAKMQIPPPIETGVSKLSGTASLSISNYKLTVRLYFEDQFIPNGNSSIFEKDDKGNEIIRELTLAEFEKESQIRVANLLQINFTHLAFIRYIEAWQENFGLDVNIFKKAVLGTKKCGFVFSGMVGGMNGRAIKKINGKWEIIDETRLYPEIKRMPKEVIENIRIVARKRNKK